ncbi:MAG: folate-binding protein [Alphaproteobacteria bacterium]|nr:folate-binding protein [Alphaproteobacteria bacterium]
MSKPFFISLPRRGLLHIEGPDRLEFLQGLITQDVTKLEQEKIQYGCLLTPQGKFLHDFFIHHGDGFILLDCEGGPRAQDLYERLNKYKLRRDVQISVEEKHPVYAVFGDEKIGLPDPRHFKMGNRAFGKPDAALITPELFEEWDQQRIILGIPDGARDMEVERSTLHEMNIPQLNGVSFDKGCYVGQEIVSRMQHRGLGKKHLRTLKFKEAPPPPFTDLEIGGKVVGNMRSSCHNIGLAIIKDEYLEELKNDENPLCLLG